jgi:tetratricopeptide (TPR) repeat protein
MKKTSLYLVIVVLFALATGFIVIKFNSNKKKKADKIYTLMPRKGPETDEWALTKKRAGVLLQTLTQNPNDIKSKLGLTALFIQEARITGNYVYYDMAALKYVNDILAQDSLNFEAFTMKALILLSQHHFAEGLAIAQKAQKINPYNAFVYGIIVDGNVEMGQYAAAVESSDKMVSIRPDIRSYSRISYLREIYGDYPGAIEAMKLAVDAGIPGDETTEWCRVQLGKLYELTGDNRSAEMHYTISLESRPHYMHALAGLARIALANKEYPKAMQLYKQADSMSNGSTFKEDIADVYLLMGQKEKASAIEKEVIAELNRDAKSGEGDENVGHYADQELAYAYLKINNNDKALYHALQEYNRRPANIDVNETLAWVYYNKGDFANASIHIHTALQTHSKNPRLLHRAELIQKAAAH